MTSMRQVISQWFKKYFSDPEAVVLFFTLTAIVILFMLFGHMLAPVLISVMFAYLMDGIVRRLEQWRVPHIVAVSLVCLFFMGLVLAAFIWWIPSLWQQMTNFFNELPNVIGRSQDFLNNLTQRYPEFISKDQLTRLSTTLRNESGNIGKVVLSYSLASITGVMEFFVYFVLVPLMVFFFLKDKKLILNWLMRWFLPQRRQALTQVWHEVNLQTVNYIRGRVIEMIIVTVVFTITFEIMGLNYAVLLAVLSAVGVIIPYVGAIVATIPVVIVALTQWGWGSEFITLMILYIVISIIDSNILVPLLFSETMSLHPVAIIVAVIVFGKLWGFWGIFFAIPLATVVKAIMTAWPRRHVDPPPATIVQKVDM